MGRALRKRFAIFTLLFAALVLPLASSEAQAQAVRPSQSGIFAPPPVPVGPAVVPQTTTLTPATQDAASNLQLEATSVSPTGARPLEECQVIGKIDGQVVQACEILWQVNQIIEDNRDRIPPQQEADIRQMLMQQRLAGLVDTKLLYAEFLRNVPRENVDNIFEKLEKPFEEVQIPRLMKQFKVENPEDLERQLHALGTSMRDMKQAFREQALS